VKKAISSSATGDPHWASQDPAQEAAPPGGGDQPRAAQATPAFPKCPWARGVRGGGVAEEAEPRPRHFRPREETPRDKEDEGKVWRLYFLGPAVPKQLMAPSRPPRPRWVHSAVLRA
jgi:hypothetical protein